MIITLREFMTWTDMSIFEMWLTVLSIFISSILLTLKFHSLINISFYVVFLPVFIGFALNFYFLFIVYMRSFADYKDYKSPFIGLFLNTFRISQCALFLYLLVSKIGGELDTKEVKVQMTYGIVFMPIWILMAILSFQVCRSTNT